MTSQHKLSIDFETCSDLDVTKVGAYQYAMHPSTKIRCMAWAIDNDDPQIWIDGETKIPEELLDAIGHYNVHAWNAQFERLIFHYCLPSTFPKPTFNQWRCTAAQARMNALPGTLAKAAKVLKLDVQKQDTRIMKKLANAAYQPSDEELAQLYEYCMTDVVVERAIHQLIPEMPDDEVYIYQVNERINNLGVQIDKDFVTDMLNMLDEETKSLNSELAELTAGRITAFTQVARLTDFLGLTSLDKKTVAKMLARDDLPFDKRRALEIRQMGAKSSTAKYQVMLRSAAYDHRVRGTFVYAGAGQTGRFSGTGFQPHNLPRDVYDDADERIEAIKTLSLKQYKLLYDEPFIEQASKLIRPALIAKDNHVFVIGDYSAVEAKGVPWLAEYQPEIDAWAAGADRYIEDAANVFHVAQSDVDDRLRQAGKVVRLACGFGGRGGALMAMAEGYGLQLSKGEADHMAANWHAANPWVVEYAKVLEQSAIKAMHQPHGLFAAGGRVCYASEFIGDQQVLRCQLPSGRILSYHDAKLEESQYGGYQISAIKPREALRERLWHGLFLENVTQAVCNDLLRFALMNLYSSNYKIVAHVHDETVEEVHQDKAEKECANIKAIMEQRPSWAEDFPLTAKVHISKRYTK